MLDRITQPEKFIDAEHAGADWIKEQKKEYSGLGEIMKSFFSSKSTLHDPIANFVFKYGGIFLAGASAYSVKFLERTDNPLFFGGIFLIWGLAGIAATSTATLDSLYSRETERKRKREKITT